jgi:hypothetical protein
MLNSPPTTFGGGEFQEYQHGGNAASPPMPDCPVLDASPPAAQHRRQWLRLLNFNDTSSAAAPISLNSDSASISVASSAGTADHCRPISVLPDQLPWKRNLTNNKYTWFANSSSAGSGSHEQQLHRVQRQRQWRARRSPTVALAHSCFRRPLASTHSTNDWLLEFQDRATAGDATIINNGVARFQGTGVNNQQQGQRRFDCGIAEASTLK